MRCYPDYVNDPCIQEYLRDVEDIEDAKVLSQFRLGDAGLGNRDIPKVEICPACNNGPNIESHLVFECSSMDELRKLMETWIDMSSFLENNKEISDINDKLRMFLGNDWSSKDILHKRARYLSILKDKHSEYKDKHSEYKCCE